MTEQVISLQSFSTLSDREKNEMDKNGDGKISIQELKQYTETRKDRSRSVEAMKTQFSQKTLQKMDHDGDGKISQGELNAYIRRVKSKAGRYRLYLIISLILFFLVMFGIFLLGFEITRQFGVNLNKTSPQGTRKLTDRHGNELSTIVTLLPVDVSRFWDDDVDDERKTVTIKRIYSQGTVINCKISRVEIIDNITTLYDFTGNVWFEYYRNDFVYTYNDTGASVGGSWIRYERDPVSGNITVTPHDLYTVETRRMLEDEDEIDESEDPYERRRLRGTPAPTPAHSDEEEE